jgi:predicted ATP-grasp superfamily ATP-dependent carboligase
MLPSIRERLGGLISAGHFYPATHLVAGHPYNVHHIFRSHHDTFVCLERDYLIRAPQRYRDGFRNLCTFLRTNNVEEVKMQYLGTSYEGDPLLIVYGIGFFMYLY